MADADTARVLAEVGGILVTLGAMLKLLWTQRRMKSNFESHLIEVLAKRDEQIRLIEEDLEVCKSNHMSKDLEMLNVRSREREHERLFLEARAEKRELERLVFMLNGQINVLMASQFGMRSATMLPTTEKPT